MKTYTVQTRCVQHGTSNQSRGMREDRLDLFLDDCRHRGEGVTEGKCYVVEGLDGCTVVIVAIPEPDLMSGLPLSA